MSDHVIQFNATATAKHGLRLRVFYTNGETKEFDAPPTDAPLSLGYEHLIARIEVVSDQPAEHCITTLEPAGDRDWRVTSRVVTTATTMPDGALSLGSSE